MILEEGPIKIEIIGTGYHPAYPGVRDSFGQPLEPDEPAGFDEIYVYVVNDPANKVDITEALDDKAISFYHDLLMEDM